MVGILVLRVARSLVPLAVLWIGKLIVDEVVHAIGVAGTAAPVDWARLAELVGDRARDRAGRAKALARLSALLESLLGDLFANRTSVELMRHAATLDLEQFEDAGALRQARAGPAADGGPDRALHPAAADGAGRDHAGHAGRRARGLRPLAARPAGDRGAALASGRDPLRLARLLAALLLDPGAAAARLSPLHRRQRRLRQGAQALRAVGLPGGPLRPADRRSSTRPTSGSPSAGAWSRHSSPRWARSATTPRTR